MVDVSAKASPPTYARWREGGVGDAARRRSEISYSQDDAEKGDVLGTARIAGIMAAKRTHELIPLCHPLLLSKVAVEIEPDRKLPGWSCSATVKVTGTDRRRDGGADRRVGRVPDDLRHGEGGRARHAHRGHPPDREKGRQVGALTSAKE